ncbi:MAG: hypothetical protein FD173_318 [Gallionellaceae bacterium]|nr:MAG: hypothetical protein FD173_318 [Gallionellaceae bacterium]
MPKVQPLHRKLSRIACLLAMVLAIASAAAQDILPIHAKDAAAKRALQAKINLLVRAGKVDEAASAIYLLYPNGPPPGGEMALEYYDVVGNTEKGWKEAFEGLKRLVDAAPEDVSYRMAFARQLARRSATRREGIQMLAEMVKQPDLKQQALGEWRWALSMPDNNALRIERYRDYLKADPGNTSVIDALAIVNREESERQAGKMREIAAAQVAAGHQEDAAASLNKGLQLNPKNAWVRFDLSRLYHAQGDSERGRILMKKGMAAMPGDADMMYASALYIGLADDVESALRLLDKIPATKRSPPMLQLKQQLLDQLRAKQMQKTAVANSPEARVESLSAKARDVADQQLAAGHTEEAIATLAQALQAEPKNPWVRFDLARIYYKRGAKKQGHALMEEGMSVAPGDDDVLYAYALYDSLSDDMENALRLIGKIPVAKRSTAMQRLHKKLTMRLLISHALADARAGKNLAVQEAMVRATADAEDDEELVNMVANAWVELKDPARGIALMRPLVERPSAPMVAQLYYAKLLNRAEKNEELAVLLEKLSASSNLTDGDKAELRYLKSSLASHRADNLRHAGKLDEARVVLEPAMREDARNTDLLHALARVHIAAHESQRASETYRQILQLEPKDVRTRLALLKLMFEEGEQTAARDGMDELLMSISEDDVDVRMAIADGYLAMGDIAAGRKIVEDALNIAPDNNRVLIEAGRVARAEGRTGKAIAYFTRAGANEEIADLESGRAKGYVTAGIENLSKVGGAPGISDLVITEIPVEARIPVGYDGGLAIVQATRVNADAGALSLAGQYDLRQFGKVQALSPNITNKPDQSASGTALLLGYEGDGIRADIGTTPLEFPVHQVVGGVRWSKYTENSGFSFDVSSRTLTSSLLAYAGVRDPVTGEVWGGVRNSGAGVHVARSNGRLNGFVDVGYYWLTGTNVLDNTKLELRTGFDWSFVKKEDMLLTAGLTLTHWAFREDLSHYSFGHGGYYSPQSYVSLALPLRWTGRVAHWSYLLQYSISASETYTKDMPYYPTNAALQNSTNATYTGGISPYDASPPGYALGAALEYQFSSRLFAGGRFMMERSPYYAPDTGFVYLRYMFDDYTSPIPYPPLPVKSYSKY